MPRRFVCAACLALFLLAPVLLSALWVDEGELIQGQPVEFRNFNGDYTVSETEDAISGIGKELARISVSNYAFYTAEDAYSILHAIDTNTTNRLSADILSVGKASKARHINAIRLVLAAYLSERYGYTVPEGRVLALFISWYNGMHRGDMNFFSSRYCASAISNLDARTAGIASNYQEWPGATRIVIPLMMDDVKVIRPVESGEISEKKVIEALRKRADRGLPERKELLGVKQKEIEERKQEVEKKTELAVAKKETVRKQEKQLEQKKEELASNRETVSQKEEDLRDKKKQAAAAKTDEEKKEAGEKVKKAEADVTAAKTAETVKETEVKKTEADVQAEKAATAKADKDAAAEKDKLEKKEADVEADKTAIRKDETEVKAENNPQKLKEDLVQKEETLAKKEETLSNREAVVATNEQNVEEKKKELDVRENEVREKKRDQNVFAGKLYYLRVRNFFGEGRYHNDLYVINGVTRQVEKRSALTNISGKKFDIAMDGVVVIALRDEKSPDALALLDRDTLEVKTWSKEPVFWRSSVEIRDDSVYAVTISNDQFWLGKFDNHLELLNRSPIEVDRDTFFSFYGDYVYVTDPNRKVIALSGKDLSLVGEVTDAEDK
jgi:hypothetical protein